jgi:predicted nuclease of predicted toxin-antitoxin system
VKLLLDQNLSPRLVAELEKDFPGSCHVRDLGLARADDAAIWLIAREKGYAIVSKDADFHQMSFLHGFPPKVLWLRLGNCTTDEILAAMRRHLDSIALFDESEDAAFLTLP